MRKHTFSHSLSSAGEPQIIVEESSLSEEETDRRRNESPPRCLDPDSPSLNPYLLSPWRESRKHSLPTPQCTSGITASQVRRLSERGGEGSGPSPREAAFLATLSQAPAPQPGGRRHSVVTISKVPPTLFGRNRRESIAALPGATRVLASRDSGPPSNSGSTHNLQLDIMDDIAELKARKARLKSWRSASRERIGEVPPEEGPSQSAAQRRYSDFGAPLAQKRASVSIFSSLTSSAMEISHCGDSTRGNTSRDHRSNSFSSIFSENRMKLRNSTETQSWLSHRHQPMWKKGVEGKFPILDGVLKAVKDSLTKPKDEVKPKNLRGNAKSGGGDPRTSRKDSGSSSNFSRVRGIGKLAGKGSWFTGKDEERAETCESSIYSAVRDFFVK